MELVPEKKEDKLQVAWVYSYYGQNDLWNIQAKKVSWVVQMILKATNYLQELGYNETNLTELDRYSIGRVYLQMKSTMEMVGW